MPYGYRKTKDGYTVYKKDTGETVGHTTAGKLKGYLAALHMHSKDEAVEKKKKKEIPFVDDSPVADRLAPVSEIRKIVREEIKRMLKEGVSKEQLIIIDNWLDTIYGKEYVKKLKILIEFENKFMDKFNSLTNDEMKVFERALNNANNNEIRFRQKYIVNNPDFKKNRIVWTMVMDRAQELNNIKPKGL